MQEKKKIEDDIIAILNKIIIKKMNQLFHELKKIFHASFKMEKDKPDSKIRDS